MEKSKIATKSCVKGVNADVKTGPLCLTHHDIPTQHKPDPTIPCIKTFGKKKNLKIKFLDAEVIEELKGKEIMNSHRVNDTNYLQLPSQHPHGKVPFKDQTQDGRLNGAKEG